jgi:hypothetical protein
MKPVAWDSDEYAANNSPVIARTVVCPDGTEFVVMTDGSWYQQAWDGSPIRTDEEWLQTYYAPEHRTNETRAEVREGVIAKLGLGPGL